MISLTDRPPSYRLKLPTQTDRRHIISKSRCANWLKSNTTISYNQLKLSIGYRSLGKEIDHQENEERIKSRQRRKLFQPKCKCQLCCCSPLWRTRVLHFSCMINCSRNSVFDYFAYNRISIENCPSPLPSLILKKNLFILRTTFKKWEKHHLKSYSNQVDSFRV